jgi:hypothetical protein
VFYFGSIDYKSIALPAELQWGYLICSINRLIIQLIQSIKDLSSARRALYLNVDQLLLICRHMSWYGNLIHLGFIKAV